jgi:Putative zinc-finger
MTLERKTTALEFETMLRRHLRRGGAPVSACAGFDPDRASAYLEGGLGDKARGRYEAHLAGCPACRRHVIELSRLSQLALQAEAAPHLTSRRLRWRSSLAERMGHWVDPSSWWLNWRLTGTALAGCAILAFAMIARPWRQLSFTDGRVSITTARQEANASAAMQASSPTPPVEVEDNDSILVTAKRMDAQSPPAAPAIAGSSAGNAQAGDAQRERALALPKQAIPEPRIVVPPTQVASAAAQIRALEQSESVGGAFEAPRVVARNDRVVRDKEEHRLASELESASPPPAVARRRARREAAAEFIPTAKRITSGSGSEVLAGNRNKVEDDQLKPSMAIPRMTPNPEYNPMQSGLRERGIPEAKNENSSLPNPKTSFWAYFTPLVDYVKSYWPLHRPNLERSFVIGKDAKSEADNETNGNSGKHVKHFRGKTFRYVRGVWIDDEYDADMSSWRLTWLRRGSEAYNRVLAEEPQLKDFFDFGPIIIVWKDKIYRVQVAGK